MLFFICVFCVLEFVISRGVFYWFLLVNVIYVIIRGRVYVCILWFESFSNGCDYLNYYCNFGVLVIVSLFLRF